ncbi:BZ3500_MvSof-1268-A1-R1_Chr1-3g02304 [Microbotryum saponariae]|uniref:BZ3500_MvSof-1268-A1-R1_Chr1-3g02304 protein n=1 Tax=Microbotryum saponariae TaxID=289078 RepID=A0A2X0LAG9_9BASI|nr:BZ3500_MvSof-1268-A1-R1_Chr1-3g02304 [Microbotryum saponariae]SCZ95931.1 BZ3501_MvSof-1269-A2-R1_Chr1-3g01907 [Microbotryum saponariae]
MHDCRAVLNWRDTITAPSTVGGSSSPPTTLSFISLLNIVLATGLQYLADNDTIYVSRFTADYRVLESSLRLHSKMASDLSEAEEPPDLNRVEAIMLQALYFQNCSESRMLIDGPDSRFFPSVRVTGSDGRCFHQAGPISRTISPRSGFARLKLCLLPYEAELRRRCELLEGLWRTHSETDTARSFCLSYLLLVWWSIYCHDRRNSIALGRPYIIHDRHCDVNMTANADLDGLSPLDPAPIRSRPLTEYTKASVEIFAIELCRLGGGITDYMQSSRPHTYTDILALDDMFVAFESNLPPHFDMSQHVTPVKQEGAFLNFSILTYRIQMHRRYLLRRVPELPAPDPTAQSRRLAVQWSLSKLTREQMRYFTVPFHVFEGAATLAIATLQTPSDQAFVELNDRWIVDARDALIQMGDDNVTASEAALCLDALRHKISTIVPPRTRLAPVHPPRDPIGATITKHSGFTSTYSNGRHASVSSTSSTNSRLGSGLGSHPPVHSDQVMSSQSRAATGADVTSEYDEWWLKPEGGELVWPLGQGALEFNQRDYWTHLLERIDTLMPPKPSVFSL